MGGIVHENWRVPRSSGNYVMEELGAETTSTADRVKVLQEQMNRYKSPAGTALLGSPFPGVPVNGVLDWNTAMLAAVILARRAHLACLAYGDRATCELKTAASARVTTPLPWVADHLEEVISQIAMFADNNRISPPGGGIARLVSDWRVWAAAAAIGLYAFSRKRGRR